MSFKILLSLLLIQGLAAVPKLSFFGRGKNHPLKEILEDPGKQLNVPPGNYSLLVMVIPTALLELDKSTGRCTLFIYMNAMWEDSDMTWQTINGTKECVTLSKTQAKNLWVPEIALLHDQLMEKKVIEETAPQVCSTGRVAMNWQIRLQFLISGDTYDFPFDTAELIFLVKNLHYRELRLSPIQSYMKAKMPFHSIPEWIMVSRHCESIPGEFAYPGIDCRLLVKRNPGYYVVNFAIPAVLVTAMGIISQHSALTARPRSSKYQMALITLISLSTISLTIAGSLPRSGTISRLHVLYYSLVFFLFSSGMVAWLTVVCERDIAKFNKKVFRILDMTSICIHIGGLLGVFFWFVYGLD